MCWWRKPKQHYCRRVFGVWWWHGGVGAIGNYVKNYSSLTVQTAPKRQPENIKTYFPPLDLCTDNGAMIAFAGAMRLVHGVQDAEKSGSFDVKPRWRLNEIVRDKMN